MYMNLDRKSTTISQAKTTLPFKDRRKEWMKAYMSSYMKEYYKDKMVICECGCVLFPHAIKKHRDSLKHKYLITIQSRSDTIV